MEAGRIAGVALVAIDRGVVIADQTVHPLRIVHVAASSPSDRRQVGRQKDPQRSLLTKGSKHRRSLCVGAPKQRLPGAVIVGS